MGLGVQQRWDSEHVRKKSCLIDIHNVGGGEGNLHTQKDFHTIDLQLLSYCSLCYRTIHFPQALDNPKSFLGKKNQCWLLF